jgi:hypothetical protein
LVSPASSRTERCVTKPPSISHSSCDSHRDDRYASGGVRARLVFSSRLEVGASPSNRCRGTGRPARPRGLGCAGPSRFLTAIFARCQVYGAARQPREGRSLHPIPAVSFRLIDQTRLSDVCIHGRPPLQLPIRTGQVDAGHAVELRWPPERVDHPAMSDYQRGAVRVYLGPQWVCGLVTTTANRGQGYGRRGSRPANGFGRCRATPTTLVVEPKSTRHATALAPL